MFKFKWTEAAKTLMSGRQSVDFWVGDRLRVASTPRQVEGAWEKSEARWLDFDRDYEVLVEVRTDVSRTGHQYHRTSMEKTEGTECSTCSIGACDNCKLVEWKSLQIYEMEVALA
jgi:hypothetical protein